jgi:DNA-binding XRE family transcriptional regulator
MQVAPGCTVRFSGDDGPRVGSDVVEGSGDGGSTIGRQLRLIRRSRGMSQQVIADLAEISKSHLSRLESGQRALDRRSLIMALANALEVSRPS